MYRGSPSLQKFLVDRAARKSRCINDVLIRTLAALAADGDR